MSISLCEDCVYYSYDEESDSYYVTSNSMRTRWRRSCAAS